MLERVLSLIGRLSFICLDKEFQINAELDKKFHDRVYVQLSYSSKCTKTGILDSWKGRKWYLSEFMTDDEIVKTVYCACEAAVKHEIMEGFKCDGIVVFNPHVNFEELLKISDMEIKRGLAE